MHHPDRAAQPELLDSSSLPISERNIGLFAVTVVAVLGAIQQDEAVRVHVEARLRRTALVNSSVT